MALNWLETEREMFEYTDRKRLNEREKRKQQRSIAMFHFVMKSIKYDVNIV